jgi:hypothetical protein
LNEPLRQDLCQRIHCAALGAAARGWQPDAIPVSVSLVQLQQQVGLYGVAACLAHPADVEAIFNGVTLRIYQTIETLYCDRLNRSIRRVWQILRAMTDRAGLPPVGYEAVWAICLYLENRRVLTCRPTLRHSDNAWWLVKLVPHVHLRNKTGVPYPAAVVCILDAVRVLAFRMAPEESCDTQVSLALYDAIVSQRQPSMDGTGGLAWHLPRRLVSETDLSGLCRDACATLRIQAETASTDSPLVRSLHSNWARDLSDRPLREEQFTALFDNYLCKQHGYGPLTAQRPRDRAFAHRIGYSRDPAWQLPALRELLPLQHSVIAEDGAVEYDGLHYADALLAHWIGRPVTLRRSESAEAVAWVYLDDEILCQAVARELKRRDGSYRPNRPRK